MKRLAALIVAVAVAWCGEGHAHHPQPAQPQPVVAWQIQYQPVWVPGQYIVTPRPLPVLDWVFGPRVWWTPLPMQQQPITQQTQ